MNTIDTSLLPIKVSFVAQTKRDDWDCFEWRVEVSSTAGFWTFPYFCGLGHVHKHRVPGSPAWGKIVPKKPSNDDILHSLLLDSEAANMNFHEWCAEFGYSDDSIKALNTYKECLNINTHLLKHLGRDTIEALKIQLADY